MSEDEEFEREQEDEAAREAAGVGGPIADRVDPAQRAVIEGGGGESEGFELAEQALIEHASHTDEQSAHAILHHQGLPEEPEDLGEEDAGDHELSSERESQD